MYHTMYVVVTNKTFKFKLLSIFKYFVDLQNNNNS